MTTDNRTNEPNKYAGFLARQNHQRDQWRGIGAKCLCGKVFDLDADHAMHQVDEILRAALEAALVAAQGAAPQAEQATYLNVAHSSVLAGYINARRAAREVSAMQLIDAIYDPDEDDANDSVRYGYVLEQFERLRIIYADLDDPDAGPAPVLPSSGATQAESEPKSSYISPSLPAQIRGLYRADLREKSIQTMLDLAGDLIQELIDLRAAQVLSSSGADEEALAEVIEETRREWRTEWIVMQEREEPVPTTPDEWVARAVAEWLKGQGR